MGFVKAATKEFSALVAFKPFAKNDLNALLGYKQPVVSGRMFKIFFLMGFFVFQAGDFILTVHKHQMRLVGFGLFGIN